MKQEKGTTMHIVTGSFKNGVATPDEPVHGHEGQAVLITFLGETGIADEDDMPTLEEVVERIKSLGPSDENYIPPTMRLSDVIPNVSEEPPIDPAEWDRQWAEIEAEMKRRDLEDDRAEGRF